MRKHSVGGQPVTETLLKELVQPADTKLVLLVVDGLAGLPYPDHSGTALHAARTPNLDRLAKSSSCGLLDPIAPGITPGSGPAHLGLFGYDPVACAVGRGVLEALGAGFALLPGDLAIRVNFCTVDGSGVVVDRRAGRLPTDENRRVVERLRRSIVVRDGVELFLGTAAEHRAYLVLRGPDLSDAVRETDPQKTGVPPLTPDALEPEAGRSAELLHDFLAQAQTVLRDEQAANMLLLRGYSIHRPLPTFRERYGLRALALADYPMYRGLASLVGMEVPAPRPVLRERVAEMATRWTDWDFFFLHFKKADSAGEDGDFSRKVHVIEEVDAVIPSILALAPDVLVVTADHATPCILRAHSWHPVPLMLHSTYCLPDAVASFDEVACSSGCLGRMPSSLLMQVMLANAGRLRKYGA
jgi:2,3-bisphosphoglycerate-independent phosphoglycerate mutase